jgi:major type 1 subunit fimbrin (pilin)
VKRFGSSLDRALAALLLLALSAWMPAAHAATQACTIYGASGITFDVPFGQVAFSYTTTGPVGPQLSEPIAIHCPQSVFSGAADKSRMVIQGLMNGGTYDGSTTTWTLPTGDPNLDVQLRLVNSSPAATPTGAGNLYDFVSLNKNSTDWDATFTLQLVKRLGTVDPNKVPTTLLQLFNTKDGNQADRTLIATVRIGAGTSIRSLSCMASSVTVELPTVMKQALATTGATAGTTPVPIRVSNCQPGTQLSVALTGTPAVNPATGTAVPASWGVVQSTGTDQNVAVQVLDNASSPPTDISGNTNRYMGQVPAGGGDVSITYYARYYALRPAQGGRVKAGLTFTLSYP